MSAVSADTSVAQLVTDRPARARVFEQLGIDYCCGGERPLAEACAEKNLDPKTVVKMLDVAAEAASAEPTTDWSDVSLTNLIEHITSTHHDYLRRELPRLERLLAKTCRAHGDQVSWLQPAWTVFQSLKQDLFDHMKSEEEYVFPAIRTLAAGRVLPDGSSLDGSAIEQMEDEHDEAGRALQQLRTLTSEYTPPEWACPTFRAALDGLRELEGDMHRHVHKENNILFPRARSLA